MIEIRSLKGVGIDELYEVFSDAFKNYIRTWNKEEIERTLHRRAYVPELSFGAFDDGRLVSFTFNGFGTFNGIETAYDTGTGTISDYRGKGLATKIFAHSVPYLKRANVKQYLLEVLQDNKDAVSVYTKAGFKTNREFNFFVQEAKEIKPNSKMLPDAYHLKEISFDLKEEMKEMWDFSPSWQNNFAAILRKPADFKALGVFKEDELVAYGVIEPSSGDIPQLAVNKARRRNGLASVILNELLKLNACPSMKVVNTDLSCRSITEFLLANNIPIRGKQFEMIRNL